MADRRLVWNQLTAPDLSAASAAIARANQSFNAGFEGGASILERYGSAQKTRADDEILAEIAGLGDETEFDAFIDGGGLAGRNLSEGMRNTILSLRGNLVDQEGVRARTDGTRASTANTRATTGINLARESRSATEFQDQIARRDFLRENSALGGDATQFADKYGNTVGGLTEVVGDGQVQRQVYQGLLDRGLPEHVAQGFMLNFLDESGFNPSIEERTPNVHGTRGRGLYQLTGARREAFEARFGNDYSIDNQLDFLMEELNGSERNARDAIFAAQNAGDAGAAIVSRFLRPAEEHRVERSNRYRGTTYDVPTGGRTIQQDTPVQAYRRLLEESGQFTRGEIESEMSSITGAANAREEELIAADEQATAQAEAERRASAILGAVQDPNNLSGVQAGRSLLTDEAVPATDRLGDVAALEGALQSSTLQGILAPEVEGDPETAAIVENSLAASRAELNSTDQARAIGDIERYAEDPAASLEADLGLHNDGQAAGVIGGFLSKGQAGYDRNNLRNLINDYARQFKVEPSVVAVAMRDVFERDPLTILGFNANTLENRFERDRVENAIGQLTQERIRAFREGSSNVDLQESEMRAVQSQARTLRQQIAKTPEGPQREALEAQLATIDIQLAEIEGRRRNQ